MAWFSKDDYVRTPYRRRRAANMRNLVVILLLVFSVLILALLGVLVMLPSNRTLPDPDSWEMKIVEAPLADDFTVTVLALPQEFSHDTVYFDARAYDALCKMLADAAELGYTPIVTQGYETFDQAKENFLAEQRRLRQSGFSVTEAYQLAEENVPHAAYSEYRLGLCVDFTCDENVAEFAQSQFYDWLVDYAHEYGFIPRGDARTWRYVGTTAAKQIKKRGETLEEYVAYIRAEIAEEEQKNN
ncbi:MAG: D-alanyl-D-alanine carboxypeptidase family protein [Clostridia bacterium]|nr:D-alanyl-D-alanine carboxypeptidase family protein [Clostridia bacterium]